MSVNQTYVDNLKDTIVGELFAVSELFTKRANNGIVNNKIKKDISRLYSLVYILENYDVSADYFDDEYILKIEGEYSNHCGYKKTNTVAFVSGEAISPQIIYTNQYVEVIYEANPSGTLSTDNASTGVALPETPVSLDVFINGVEMMVGDGSKTKDVYFSSDGGTTAKTITTLAASDTLYYNAVIVGTSITATDLIRFKYIKSL